jgi:hypothetical protein
VALCPSTSFFSRPAMAVGGGAVLRPERTPWSWHHGRTTAPASGNHHADDKQDDLHVLASCDGLAHHPPCRRWPPDLQPGDPPARSPHAAPRRRLHFRALPSSAIRIIPSAVEGSRWWTRGG